MIRNLAKLATVTLFAALAAASPAVAAGTQPATTIRTAVQPAPANPIPQDWARLDRCWVDRGQLDTPAGRRAAAAALPDDCKQSPWPSLLCDWRVDYPSRYWVEQACGRIDTWGPDFGSSYSPEGKRWVEYWRNHG